MWFHQHFGVGRDPLRVINYWGGPTSRWGIAVEKDDDVKSGNLFGIHEGGRTILYPEEDPWVRNYYRQRLADEGVQFSPDDDIPFADRGYDSLAMIELASQLEQRTGIRIPDDVALERLTSPRRTLEFINENLAAAERS